MLPSNLTRGVATSRNVAPGLVGQCSPPDRDERLDYKTVFSVHVPVASSHVKAIFSGRSDRRAGGASQSSITAASLFELRAHCDLWDPGERSRNRTAVLRLRAVALELGRRQSGHVPDGVEVDP